ncbi:LamG-like jellyroll fold domain-containing protein [Algoriphagus aquatilis]|uniref:LamG-like jellyroll fold domain-containing protein n=1 Tax=Algoriphagus aquatilis TaxID=490186 RepID=A0ABW0C120_9BACT
MKKLLFLFLLITCSTQSCTVVDTELLELVLEIKNQNQELLEEVKALQAKSDSLINELKNSAAKQEEVLKKVTDLQAELVKVLAQIGTLNEQLGAQNADLDEIKSQLADLQEKYQGILEQLEQLQKLSQILAEIEKLKGQLAELDGKYQVIQGSLTQTKEQLDALKGQVASLQAQLAENLTKISQLTSQLGEQGANIEKILAAIEELKKSCAEIKALLENQLSGKSPIPTNGLVGWWPFNGNANDESGNGNNGKLVGPLPASGKLGLPNSAYSFNGIKDIIEFPSPMLNGQVATTFSIFSRVFPKKIAYMGIWNKTGFWKEVNFTFKSDGSVELFWAFTNFSYNGGTSLPNLLKKDSWYDIIIVMESNKLNFYINGVFISSSIVNGKIDFSQAANDINRLGQIRISNIDTNFFDGIFDDLGFWNRALTAEEISKIYKGEGF